MFEIKQEMNEIGLNLALIGRLDTMTSPELEEVIKGIPEDCMDVTMNFGKLEYISSSGLRVLLVTQKQMNAKKGTFTLTDVQPEIMEVFEITGFSDILNIV